MAATAIVQRRHVERDETATVFSVLVERHRPSATGASSGLTLNAEMGLVVDALEDDPKIQDAVLTVHHAFIHTLSGTAAVKIIENQLGVAFIQQVQQIQIRATA